MNYTECDSPLGIVRAFFDGDTLTGLYFVGQKYDRGLLSGDARMIDAAAPARALRQWLSDYFEGDARPYPGKLAMRGTAFQQAVWQTLRGIGHGHTRSYGEIAEQMGHAMAVRAVGAAVGRNPVSIIVPCHRVLGSTGSLTGYAGGVDRKAALLTLESATFGRR